jgi:hypothetical protein
MLWRVDWSLDYCIVTESNFKKAATKGRDSALMSSSRYDILYVRLEIANT